ncbi:MAG: homoserine kinase [Pseudomonadota bacterium]
MEAFLADYDHGAPTAFKGIAEGVENSNFFLQTDRGRFILTLYEKRVRTDELPFFLELMEHVNGKGIACPSPVPNRAGRALGELNGRPAVIITFLDGVALTQPKPLHCRSFGGATARLHDAVADFSQTRKNTLAVGGWRDLVEALGARVDDIAPGLADDLAQELDWVSAHWPAGLPTGVVHADLFPDNVFFLGDELSGFIDFYFACTDAFAYDLAICLNAWCFDARCNFVADNARALFEGYLERRALSPAERAALPTLARGAALRFLLTRAYDWLNRVEGALVVPKDPLEYLRKLHFHRTASGPETYGLESA